MSNFSPPGNAHELSVHPSGFWPMGVYWQAPDGSTIGWGYLIERLKIRMAAATKSSTLSVEQQELLIESCFEGESVALPLSF